MIRVRDGLVALGLTVWMGIPWVIGLTLGSWLLAFRIGFVLGFQRLGQRLSQ
jgi:hypothetical protein